MLLNFNIRCSRLSNPQLFSEFEIYVTCVAELRYKELCFCSLNFQNWTAHQIKYKKYAT